MKRLFSEVYPIDHLVIIGRDRLLTLAQAFSSKGFQLSPIARHNLGSINQLIMLDSTYIELLGWEANQPVQRAEIANQAIGLDALVFRTHDAHKTYQQLVEKGFSVNPVQDLSREADFLGKSVLVQFKTVRFSEQPIPGIRIYFCEHLTPEYVWQTQWLQHQNQLSHLKRITLASPTLEATAKLFSALLNLGEEDIQIEHDFALLRLPNIELLIQKSPHLHESCIVDAQVSKTPLDPVDCMIDSHSLQNL